MDAAELREICLSFPGAFEDFPFGPETSVFKVRSAVAGGARHEAKMFAASAMDPDDWSVSLKCEPALAGQLRAAHPEITGAWHMNKRHWNGVRLDGSLPDSMVRDMVEASYDLVVASLSRKQQEQLGWARLAGAPEHAGEETEGNQREHQGQPEQETAGK
jgi:predicted DNA-binding protein (MmcQ/YjbR family)